MQQEQLLLDAIREDPDDRDNYAVYGDWLAQRGDARGELIGLSIALERNPADAKLGKRVHQLLAKQAKELPPRLDVTWKLGFVSELRLDPEDGAKLDVLRHPLLQLVESISLADRETMFGGEKRDIYPPLLARVVELAPRTLRHLEIGDTASPVFAKIGQLQRLLEHFPRLNELAILARSVPPGLVEVLAPRTRALELAGPAVKDRLMAAIATATWPHLRRLVLHVPWRDRSAKQRIPLDLLMRGGGFPALVDLRVREHPTAGGFTERFCMEIVKAPLLARLEVLDFTTRELDVDIVRPSYPQLRHLKQFLPSAEDETDSDALQQLTYLLEEPDTHRAIQLTRKVRDLATSVFDLHNINRRLGTALSLVGAFDEAIEALDASLVNEPACGVTLHHKAWTLKCLGRIDEAVEVLSQAEATSRHPAARPSLLYLKASLDVARGKPADRIMLQEARQLFVDDLRTRVVDADIHYELACVYALMGDIANTLATLSITFDLCPHYRAWAKAELDFAGMRDTPLFRALLP